MLQFDIILVSKIDTVTEYPFSYSYLRLTIAHVLDNSSRANNDRRHCYSLQLQQVVENLQTGERHQAKSQDKADP